MTNQHEKMADFLEWLADAPTKDIPDPRHGTYSALRTAGFDALRFKCAARRWKKFSGSPNFPVPYPSCDPRTAFFCVENLWDKRTTYGRDRRELCRFVAKELREEDS